MIETKNEILSFRSSMIVQCLVLFIGLCAGIFVNKYFLIPVAAFTIVISIFGKVKYTYYHLLFCLPFTMVYKMSPSSTSLFIYVLLVVGVVLIIKTASFASTPFFLIMFFAVYTFWGMGNNFTIVIKMVMGMLLFLVFVKKIKPSDFKNHILSFALGMLGSSCIGLFKGKGLPLDMFFNDMNTIYIDGVQSYRFSGLYLDPNYYSVSVVFALTLCTLLFINGDGNRVMLGLIISALTVFGFISYSKMFLIVVIIAILIFVIGAVKPPRRLIITLITFFIGGIILLNWMKNGDYLSVMSERLFGEEISSGRFEIWTSYLHYIKNSPITLLLGDGLKAEYLEVGGPHNTAIETVYFIGLLGGLLFLFILITIFLYRKIKMKRNIIHYALIILFGIMSSTLGCLTINDLMFYCMLMWGGFNYNMEKTESLLRNN